MIEKICTLFLLWIIYSFFGWSMEVIGKLIEKHKFINRGFLIGPLCPIYGCGCLLLVLLLDKYKYSIVLLFTMSIVICSILEYSTSYIMEKLFNARWWDYTRKKFNLNGRICAETMIPFGILGCLVVHFVNPFLLSILDKLSMHMLVSLSVIILTALIVDIVMTVSIMLGVKDMLITIEKDGTEEITKKVKQIIYKRGDYLYKRLIDAFPTITSNKERLLMLKEKINSDLSKMNKKIKKRRKTS